MSDMLKVFGIGRLTKDAEAKQIGDSTVLRLSVAVNHSVKKNGVWENVASFWTLEYWTKSQRVAEIFQKGRRVAFDGTLMQESYEKDGIRKMVTKIRVSDIKPLDAPKDDRTGDTMDVSDDRLRKVFEGGKAGVSSTSYRYATGTQYGTDTRYSTPATSPVPNFDGFEDDIPF